MTTLSTIKEAFGLNRPRLSTVLVGILLIVGGYWIYNNFTKSGELSPKEDIKIEQSSPEPNRTEGSIAGERIEPGIGGGTEESTNWIARDIVKDSLKEQNNYAVQEGDTLWEIAEGHYGSGFEWGRILSANKEKIGFLSDGSQALISPGDVLVLP